MLEFLRTYWKIIALGLLVVLDAVLIFLNRRKPTKIYDSVHQTIISVLPDLINSAEASFASGQGENKLQMVLQLVYQVLVSIYGMSLNDAMKYESFITQKVEAILSTPHKKEEKL